MGSKTYLSPSNDFVGVDELKRKSDEIEEKITAEKAEYLDKVRNDQIEAAQETIDTIPKFTAQAQSNNKRSFIVHQEHFSSHRNFLGSLKHGVKESDFEGERELVVQSCRHMGFEVKEIEISTGVDVVISW